MPVRPTLALLDPRGRIGWISEVLSPLTIAEVVGTLAWDWVPRQDVERIQAAFFRCMAFGDEWAGRISLDLGTETRQIDMSYLQIPPKDFPILAISFPLDARFCRLSKREVEILRLVGAGNSSMEICDALHISHSTLDVHRTHAREKLLLPSLSALNCWAFKHFGR